MNASVKQVLAMLLPIIKDSENCELTAYPDPASGGEPITIGWGAIGGIKLGDTWTRAQADERLERDALHAIDRAAALSPILTKAGNEKRWAAVSDFVYNLGAGSYAESTFKKYIDAGKWSPASQECLKWCHGHNGNGKAIIMEGLVTRRKREHDLIVS